MVTNNNLFCQLKVFTTSSFVFVPIQKYSQLVGCVFNMLLSSL
jgi:hypothetical protein